MKRVILALTIACFVIPFTVEAQTLVISQNKCKMDKLGDIRAFADSAWIPVAQELVDEGMFDGVGSAFHHWGDEWNVVYWYAAEDVPAFLDGFAALMSQTEERFPGSMALFQGWCFEHKDSIYVTGPSTEAPPEP